MIVCRVYGCEAFHVSGRALCVRHKIELWMARGVLMLTCLGAAAFFAPIALRGNRDAVGVALFLVFLAALVPAFVKF